MYDHTGIRPMCHRARLTDPLSMPCLALSANRSEMFCSSAFFSSRIRPSSVIDRFTSVARTFLNSSTWTASHRQYYSISRSIDSVAPLTVHVNRRGVLHRLNETHLVPPDLGREILGQLSEEILVLLPLSLQLRTRQPLKSNSHRPHTPKPLTRLLTT
jgi:hypothetical protein